MQYVFILNTPVFGLFWYRESQGAYILFVSEKSRGAYQDSGAYFGGILGRVLILNIFIISFRVRTAYEID